jgi:hypothetical protein
MPTDSSGLAVAAGSENIRFIGTLTSLAGTISGVGVVFIGWPVVGVTSDPSPDSDGGGLHRQLIASSSSVQPSSLNSSAAMRWLGWELLSESGLVDRTGLGVSRRLKAGLNCTGGEIC